MATDTDLGFYRYHQDFDVTAIGDLPEVDVQSATGVTTAILADQRGGVVEVPVGSSNDDDVAAVSSNLNFQVEAGGLTGSVRFKVDTSIADMKFFVGFGDVIASADETSFSATTDTVTIDTMSDAIGFLFDNDATTKRVWVVAGKADAVTLGQALDSNYTAAKIALNTYHTFKVSVSSDGLFAEFSIDGKVVYTHTGTTPIITLTAPLAIGFWAYEQGTACEYEVDYLNAVNPRDSGDN